MHRLPRQSSPAQPRTTITTNIRVETLRTPRPATVSRINHIPTTHPAPNPARTRLPTTTMPGYRTLHHRLCRGRCRRMWLPHTIQTQRPQPTTHNGGELQPRRRKQETLAATTAHSQPQAPPTTLPTPRSHSHCRASACALNPRLSLGVPRLHTANNCSSNSKGNNNSTANNSSSRATAGT